MTEVQDSRMNDDPDKPENIRLWRLTGIFEVLALVLGEINLFWKLEEIVVLRLLSHHVEGEPLETDSQMIRYAVQTCPAHCIDKLASTLSITRQALILVRALHRLALDELIETVCQAKLVLHGDREVAERLSARRNMPTRALYLSDQFARKHDIESGSGSRARQTLLQCAHEYCEEAVHILLSVDGDVEILCERLSVDAWYI